MTETLFDIGELVRVTSSFKNIAGNFIDPSVVTLKLKINTHTVVVYVYGTNAEVIKDSTGVYHCDVSATEAGTYRYRWEGSGTIGQSAGEDSFIVKASHF